MRRTHAFLALLFLAPVAAGQGTKADYERATTVRQWTAGKVFKDRVETNWTADFTRADPAAVCERGRLGRSGSSASG